MHFTHHQGWCAMYFKQSDLFWGLRHDFVKKVMEQSTIRKCPSGTYIFREGDSALNFYMLIKGHIRLKIGDTGIVIHTICQAGECFGWSSLLDRPVYSASAECREPSDLLVVGADRLNRVIEEDNANGLVFIKRLAGLIGNRLIQNYRMVSTMTSMETMCSYGTGQVLESAVEV
jgi:CRP-like cAMP-binding protein